MKWISNECNKCMNLICIKLKNTGTRNQYLLAGKYVWWQWWSYKWNVERLQAENLVCRPPSPSTGNSHWPELYTHSSHCQNHNLAPVNRRDLKSIFHENESLCRYLLNSSLLCFSFHIAYLLSGIKDHRFQKWNHTYLVNFFTHLTWDSNTEKHFKFLYPSDTR